MKRKIGWWIINIEITFTNLPYGKWRRRILAKQIDKEVGTKNEPKIYRIKALRTQFPELTLKQSIDWVVAAYDNNGQGDVL